MKKYVDAIYNMSPVFLQNALLSVYGAKLYYERYYNPDVKYLGNLLKSQWLSERQLQEQQLSSLREILDHSYSTVKYYQDNPIYSRALGANYDATEVLRSMPVLDKETVRLRPLDFISSRFDPNSLITLNTSGTTGKSLRIYVDHVSRRGSYCFTTRYHQWAGLKNSRHNATFGGRVIVPPNQRSNVFWRYNAAMDNHIFSSYHMSDDYLPYYVEKLQGIRPEYIEAYPSAAYVLAKFLKDRDLAGINPRAVLTSGETLFDHQRDLIEEVFGCHVFDQYGCTEQALYVSQCEKGTYHVHPEYGIVEILDESDNPVGPAEVGRVVCTSFMNRAMPLLRYDIGDTAEWGEGPCSCGRNFPIIKKICGRQDDYLLLPDGRLIGRLDPIFKGIASVKLAQIVQSDISTLELRIVPGRDFNDDDRNIILNEFRKRVGSFITINVMLVDDIPKTNNGKIKSVISLVKRS